jgi:integrase/ribosomal protein L40E
MLYDYNRIMERLKARIWPDEYPLWRKNGPLSIPFNLTPKNREKIKSYLLHLDNRGFGVARKHRLILATAQLGELLGKDFDSVTKEDIHGQDGLLSKIVSKWSNETTRRMSVQVLRQFYRWMYQSEDLPEVIRGIKIHHKSTRRYPKEIFTEEEVEMIIAAAQTPLHRALVSTLYSTGCRIGELASLQVRDVFFQEDEAIIHVRESKTDERQVLLVDSSVVYLREWLTAHPLRNEDGRTLSVSTVISVMTVRNEEKLSENTPKNNTFAVRSVRNFKEAHLFVSTKADHLGQPLTYPAIRKVLRTIMQKSGINKPFNPHHWRHSRATHLAKHLNEAQLCKVMGWRMGSPMAAIYVHLAGKDTHDALRNAYGKASAERLEINTLKQKVCQTCGHANSSVELVCRKCLRPFSLADRLSYKDRLQEMEAQIEGLKEAISHLVEAGHDSILATRNDPNQRSKPEQ